MARFILSAALALVFQVAIHPDGRRADRGEDVAKNDDVVFRQIDAHTWVGTGHAMYTKSVYLVEGDTRLALIDAGTKIADRDRIVASIPRSRGSSL